MNSESFGFPMTLPRRSFPDKRGTFAAKGKDPEVNLETSRILIVGGTRGLGYGAARVLARQGAEVTILSRSPGPRCTEESGARLVRGDAADRALSDRLLSETAPHAILVAAGAAPAMGTIDRLTWDAFETNWQSDVRIAFTWVQASLAASLPAGAHLILVSSGAAFDGSPLSGGYAGAKATVMFLARYADARARELGRDLAVRSLAPCQMAPGTAVGEAGAAAYAARAGLTRQEFFARFGPHLTPEVFGRAVADLLRSESPEAHAFTLTTRTGLQAIPA